MADIPRGTKARAKYQVVYFNQAIARWLSVNDAERLRLLDAEAIHQASLDEGDFIELGVFRGGSAVLLATALRRVASNRKLYLLDSWEGLPQLHEHDRGTPLSPGLFRSSTDVEVKRILARLGLEGWCIIRKGWFHDTLPELEGPFALAHVDCDFYESVRESLVHLLPRMSAHGVIIVDDYGTNGERRFPGVQRAVQECITGLSWAACPLGGTRDASAKLVRTIPL